MSITAPHAHVPRGFKSKQVREELHHIPAAMSETAVVGAAVTELVVVGEPVVDEVVGLSVVSE